METMGKISADAGKAALDAFIEKTGLDKEAALSDLLCGLMHLCAKDLWMLDFTKELHRAEEHFRVEFLEEMGTERLKQSAGEGVERMSWWAITGRIPGDEEDSIHTVAATSKADAIDYFTEATWEDEEPDESRRKEARKNVIATHGVDIFISTVIESVFPMTVH